MTVLHVSCNLGLIQMLEAALIAANISEKGCRNQRYGGEGPPGSIEEPYHFAYVLGPELTVSNEFAEAIHFVIQEIHLHQVV